MTTLRRSDSISSLSNLYTEEQVCFFCHKETDLEEGIKLVNASQFLDCECHITTHLKCWGEYIQQTQEVYVGCPKCQTPIVDWRKHISIYEINELAKHKKYAIYFSMVFLCVILITLVVGFGIGFSIKRH